MYNLVAISRYLISPAIPYASVAECERDCETRYKVKGLKFKWSDGEWRAMVAGEDGAIVLKLVEVKDESNELGGTK